MRLLLDDDDDRDPLWLMRLISVDLGARGGEHGAAAVHIADEAEVEVDLASGGRVDEADGC